MPNLKSRASVMRFLPFVGRKLKPIPTEIPMPNPKSRASVMHFLSFVGKTSTKRALEMPMQRLGREVFSERLPMTEPISETAKRLLKDCKEEIENEKPDSKWLPKLKAQFSVLNALASHGKRVHANRLAAALAMEHGFEKEPLLSFLNAAAALKRRQKEIYDGNMGALQGSVRHDFLTHTHDVLLEEPRALSSREIASCLGYPPTEKNLGKITVATGMLDLIGLTMKLPGVPQVSGGPREGYKWIHRAYALSSETIPTWSLDWKVLGKLKEKPRTVTELAKEGEFPGGQKFGTPNGLGNSNAVLKSFLRLKKVGLVKTKTLGKGMRAELTSFGKQLLEEQESRKSLLPELQGPLLGVALQPGELSPLGIRTLEKTVRGPASREFKKVCKELKNKLEGLGFTVTGPVPKGKKRVKVYMVHSKQTNKLRWKIEISNGVEIANSENQKAL